MLKEELFYIKKDLESKNKDKNDLLVFYVKKRLDKSLNTYYEQLISNCNSILGSYELNLRNIKKIVKEKI